MSHWITVCHLEDLQPDSGVCAKIKNQQLALFYLSQTQQVYAVANFDPVAKANVLARGMIGDLGGEPMLASPLYKQHYSLITGICFEDTQLKINTYPAKLAGQQVLVMMDQQP